MMLNQKIRVSLPMVSTRKNPVIKSFFSLFGVTKLSLIKKLFLATITFPDMISGNI